MNIFLVFTFLTLVLLLFIKVSNSATPSEYRKRKSQLHIWKEMFPHASEKEIEEFLQLFMYAFLFSDKYTLHFSPNDVVLEVYGKIYPDHNKADCLELETWADYLKEEYDLSFKEIETEKLTLGKVFNIVQTVQ